MCDVFCTIDDLRFVHCHGFANHSNKQKNGQLKTGEQSQVSDIYLCSLLTTSGPLMSLSFGPYPGLNLESTIFFYPKMAFHVMCPLPLLEGKPNFTGKK